MALTRLPGSKRLLELRYLFEKSLKWAPTSYCQSPDGFEAIYVMLRGFDCLELLQCAIKSFKLNDEVLVVCCRLRIVLELGTNLVDEFGHCDEVALKRTV
jgi:hypothetical protein